MKTSATEPTRPAYQLTDGQIARLKSLDGRDPDTDDIPEAPQANWATAVRGKHYKAMKEAISIRLDGDVLDWLRSKGPGYQTDINRILREKMALEGCDHAGQSR
jgi:uncharacterized protein (DUF4415 family)